MLADLNKQLTFTLAKEYNFSGGQIKNITRRYTISNILYGKSDNPLTVLRKMCDSETIERHTDKQKLGF